MRESITIARVGRTLLSDGFDFDLDGGGSIARGKKINTKTNVKGVGQECPTHTDAP
jgi:hypothetical protein